MIYHHLSYFSPIGTLHLLSSDGALTHLMIRETPPEADYVDEADNALSLAAVWLDSYFSGMPLDIGTVPVRPSGTDFQCEVWRLLQEIPFGQAVTYGALAEKLAQKRGIPKMSAQAVGQAAGANPIAILIPCHRVIGAGDRPGGFSSGIDKKLLLLRHEGLYFPK